MHIFYFFFFVQFMQFPILDFGLDHSGSRPFHDCHMIRGNSPDHDLMFKSFNLLSFLYSSQVSHTTADCFFLLKMRSHPWCPSILPFPSSSTTQNLLTADSGHGEGGMTVCAIAEFIRPPGPSAVWIRSCLLFNFVIAQGLSLSFAYHI